MRQDAFCEALRHGLNEHDAAIEAGIGIFTPEKWKYSNGGDPEFRERVKEAKARSTKEGVFPDFLTFRENHFAYEDIRKTDELGPCPATGMPWYSRARTSAYVDLATSHLETSRRLIMVMPPGHLKSTVFGVERTVYDLVKNRNFRTLLVQKNQDEAAKQVAQVQERLSSHDYYHFRAELLEKQGERPIDCLLCTYENGTPFKPESRKQEANTKWGAYGFIISGRQSGEKDYSMQALGVGSQLQGIRADRIILDDIQDPRLGAKNPQDSREKLEWVQQVVLGRITDLQRLVVLANFFSLDDFAHKLIEAMEDFPVVNFPALDEKGVPLAPEFWSIEGLRMKKKEVGPAAWDMTWMQNDTSVADATFRRDALVAAKDHDLSLGEVPYPVTDIFVGVDPAVSDAGYCAMVVWGLARKTKQRYLIDVFNKTSMRNYDRITAQIVDFCSKYPVRKVIVESNNSQKGITEQPVFQRDIRNTGAKYTTYQTVTGLGARAVQSNYDITTIGALFDAGLITLPYGGEASERQRVDDYIDQLCRWRTDETGHSIKHLTRDMVMATLFAESEAFVLANRKVEAPKQNSKRVPRWASKAWNRGTVYEEPELELVTLP